MSEEPRQATGKGGSLDTKILKRLLSLCGDREFGEFLGELNQQTPRGAAVLGVSYLEWRVGQAIRSRFTINDETADELLGTTDRMPKLDFSSQCKLAYCLGLIGEQGLKDLGVLGKVRNRFAHQVSIRGFNHPKIQGQCDNLKFIEVASKLPIASLAKLKNKPKERLIATVFFLGLELGTTAEHYRTGKKEPPKLW